MMYRVAVFSVLSLLLFMGLVTPAFAYVGPGAAITLLGTVLGFSSLVLLGTISSIAWPIWLVFRYIQRKRAASKSRDNNP